jgi:hypothetical protein
VSKRVNVAEISPFQAKNDLQGIALMVVGKSSNCVYIYDVSPSCVCIGELSTLVLRKILIAVSKGCCPLLDLMELPADLNNSCS